jgi:hypothetical protein
VTAWAPLVLCVWAAVVWVGVVLRAGSAVLRGEDLDWRACLASRARVATPITLGLVAYDWLAVFSPGLALLAALAHGGVLLWRRVCRTLDAAPVAAWTEDRL